MKRHKLIQEHFDKVKEYSCMVCGMSPVILHHCRGGSMTRSGFLAGMTRPSDWLTIPLHPTYHNGDRGIHVIGVTTWEALYGTQIEHLIQLSLMLDYDVMAIAKRWESKQNSFVEDYYEV